MNYYFTLILCLQFHVILMVNTVGFVELLLVTINNNNNTTSKVRPVRGADNLTAIYEPIV
jgi:hypothetical protein